MARVRLKVCGITSLADAQAATSAGAEYLGFNFYRPSPRYIAPELARDIVAQLPDSVIPVGIFVNEPDPEDVLALVEKVGLRMAQLHGDESPEYCIRIGTTRTIKALRVSGDFQLSRVLEYPVNAVLLDAFDPRLYGGTGKAVDWSLAAIVAGSVRTFLAGGLSPENIREAVETVRPWAVDVNSGVESAPGIKDKERLVKLQRQLAMTSDYD